jgi:chorismate mutase
MSVETILPIIDFSLARLTLAGKVALAKWGMHKAIEDPNREALVISEVTRQAADRGLPRQFAVNFFLDQMEANKLVQYGLFATWRRDEQRLETVNSDLKDDLRPELDRLQTSLLDHLAATTELRKRPGSVAVITKEVGLYGKARQLDALFSIALDRSLARLCD